MNRGGADQTRSRNEITYEIVRPGGLKQNHINKRLFYHLNLPCLALPKTVHPKFPIYFLLNILIIFNIIIYRMKHGLVYIAGLQVSNKCMLWLPTQYGPFFVSFQCLIQSSCILSNVSYFVSLKSTSITVILSDLSSFFLPYRNCLQPTPSSSEQVVTNIECLTWVST